MLTICVRSLMKMPQSVLHCLPCKISMTDEHRGGTEQIQHMAPSSATPLKRIFLTMTESAPCSYTFSKKWHAFSLLSERKSRHVLWCSLSFFPVYIHPLRLTMLLRCQPLPVVPSLWRHDHSSQAQHCQTQTLLFCCHLLSSQKRWSLIKCDFHFSETQFFSGSQSYWCIVSFWAAVLWSYRKTHTCASTGYGRKSSWAGPQLQLKPSCCNWLTTCSAQSTITLTPVCNDFLCSLQFKKRRPTLHKFAKLLKTLLSASATEYSCK